MIILDTDHVSILQWGNQPAELLRERLVEAIDDWIGTTSITLEEQSRAIITKLGQCKKTADQPKYNIYGRLASTYRFFGRWKFADFDDEAAKQFDSKAAIPHIGHTAFDTFGHREREFSTIRRGRNGLWDEARPPVLILEQPHFGRFRHLDPIRLKQ